MAKKNSNKHHRINNREPVKPHGSFWTEIEHLIAENTVAEEANFELFVRKKLLSAREQVSATVTPATKPALSESEATPKSSPALGIELKDLRYKYLIGKLVGEDLLDNSGQMIAPKNEPITPEIVDMAEVQGKLAELIIHMTIPGLEDSA